MGFASGPQSGSTLPPLNFGKCQKVLWDMPMIWHAIGIERLRVRDAQYPAGSDTVPERSVVRSIQAERAGRVPGLARQDSGEVGRGQVRKDRGDYGGWQSKGTEVDMISACKGPGGKESVSI